MRGFLEEQRGCSGKYNPPTRTTRIRLLMPMARLNSSFDQKAEWMRDKYSLAATPTPLVAGAQFAERHYSVAEVAAMWNLSQDAIRKIFQNEPGVLILGGPGVAHKRRYTTLRIPESVLQRVHRRMTKV